MSPSSSGKSPLIRLSKLKLFNLVHPTRLELAQLKSPLPPQGSVSTKFHHGCNYSYYNIFAAKMGKLTLRPRIHARLRPRIRALLRSAIHLRLRF